MSNFHQDMLYASRAFGYAFGLSAFLSLLNEMKGAAILSVLFLIVFTVLEVKHRILAEVKGDE